MLLAPAILFVAGCGGRVSAFGGGTQSITIHATTTQIDTGSRTRYSATLADGESAKVVWSVSGGDPVAGPGTIAEDGQYTPPNFLTRDEVAVAIGAELPSGPNLPNPPADSTLLTVTPGFLQPLTPGNLTLGSSATVTVSSSMSEVGGSEGIRFTLASDTAGTPSSAGTLSSPSCVRGSISGSNPAYTVCSVTYTAPAAIAAATPVFIVGSVASNTTRSWTRIQLNAAGINSNPAAHQAHLAVPVLLGSSSGNNADYDSSLGQLADCCGGTLGALLQDASGNQYALSNNHVLARSDQSLPGETIIQPGLIDNGCTPYGYGPGTTPVAALTGYPPLASPLTNVDAAIARVTPGAVDPKGSILELGAKQQDGTLAPAPPGISSTGGKGETASLGMTLAKSGRTTGLTCAAVSAVSVDVSVDYFTDCAETSHAFTKTFTNQIALSGTSFSDAGDSGSLVVDSANAEPVGLFFAGGTDIDGSEVAIANPVSDVLATLDAQVAGANGQTSYSFVGGADHPVSCLTYTPQRSPENPTGATTLSTSERERAEAALPLAELLVNSTTGPTAGIARVGISVGKDHPGKAAIAVYSESGVSAPALASLPAFIGGIPTVIYTVPAAMQTAESSTVLRAASLTQALATKQRIAPSLLKSNPAIFGVGVGQSLDNPNEAAIVLFVDRRQLAGDLPDSLEGLRTRIVLMDRLHVTRSHATPAHRLGNCISPRRSDGSTNALDGNEFDPKDSRLDVLKDARTIPN